MTKKRKRRFEDFREDLQRTEEPIGGDGVGRLLADLKKPSPHDDSLPARKSDRLALPDVSLAEEDAPHSHLQEWKTVDRKCNAKSKRKRAADEQERIKYPELTYRCQVNTPIRISDLQALALYTIGDGTAPNWIAVKHARHTRKVVVLMVPGLERDMFDGNISIESEPITRFDCFPAGKRKEEVSSEKQQSEGHIAENNVASLTFRQKNPTHLTADCLPKPLRPLVDISDDMWSVKAPGDSKFLKIHSPIQAMLFSPIPRPKEQKSLKGPKPPAEERGWQSVRTPITHFIHSIDELRDAEYPLHPAGLDHDAEAAALEQERRDKTGQNIAGGWADTRVLAYKDVLIASATVGDGSMTTGCSVFAVDCEMVLTNDDKSSLARISIVDWSGDTVLDELVKPSLPIKNYFTQFSGMTSAILDPVKTTLSEIQVKLLDLFSPQTILLGHSLESDLSAMKLTHPFIVDTSLIYPHPRGPPLRLSLKHLAQRYLRRDIQQHDAKGHNSVEDALAVLDLAKLKCEKGPRWGTPEATGESVFLRLGRQNKTTSSGITRTVTSAMVDYGTPERGYGKHATVQIGCQNDEEIVRGVSRAVNGDSDGKYVPGEGVDFVWGRLRELERLRGWCNNNREYSTVDQLHGTQPSSTCSLPPDASGHGSDLPSAPETSGLQDQKGNIVDEKKSSGREEAAGLHSTVCSTVSHIHEIYDSLPPCTLFIVYTGTGDPRQVGRLQQMQQHFRKEFKVKKWDDLTVKWTDDEEQSLRKAVEKAREGIGFMCIK